MALLTLTFGRHVADREAAAAIRGFWDRYRKAFGPRKRVSWLELQRSGRHHYHAMIADPPTIKDGHTKHRLEELWQVGFVRVNWRSANWFSRRGARYAMSYAKKIGAKAYQQDYERVGREIRTFQSDRLTTVQARVAAAPSWFRRTLQTYGLDPLSIKTGPQGKGRVVGVRMAETAGDELAYLWLRVEGRIASDTREQWPPGSRVIQLSAPIVSAVA